MERSHEPIRIHLSFIPNFLQVLFLLSNYSNVSIFRHFFDSLYKISYTFALKNSIFRHFAFRHRNLISFESILSLNLLITQSMLCLNIRRLREKLAQSIFRIKRILNKISRVETIQMKIDIFLKKSIGYIDFYFSIYSL